MDVRSPSATCSSIAGRLHVDYSGGERYPHLQRIEGAADLLSDIMRPHGAAK